MITIKLRPGALDHVPVKALLDFLYANGLRLKSGPDGVVV